VQYSPPLVYCARRDLVEASGYRSSRQGWQACLPLPFPTLLSTRQPFRSSPFVDANWSDQTVEMEKTSLLSMAVLYDRYLIFSGSLPSSRSSTLLCLATYQHSPYRRRLSPDTRPPVLTVLRFPRRGAFSPELLPRLHVQGAVRNSNSVLPALDRLESFLLRAASSRLLFVSLFFLTSLTPTLPPSLLILHRLS